MYRLLLVLLLAGCAMQAPKQFQPTTMAGAQCKQRCTENSPADSFGRNANYNNCIDACVTIDRMQRGS